MIGEAEYFDAAASDTDKIRALLEFVAWCVSEGNHARVIAGKLSAVLHFHRVNLQVGLPTSSALTKRALKGAARSQAAAGTPKRARCPISWDALLGGQGLVVGPGGRVICTTLALGYVSFCGEVGRDLRLADRSGAPPALFDEERRGDIQGGGTVDLDAVAPGHQHRGSFSQPEGSPRPTGVGYRVLTRPRLGDTFWGRSRRRCRRSHGGVTVGVSDDAGQRPLVVVSVR